MADFVKKDMTNCRTVPAMNIHAIAALVIRKAGIFLFLQDDGKTPVENV
jgi:hypothetical protein